MSISALDKDTVKLISTTQVVTSISSATKELIENSLDANARNIEINLTDNGCTLIEVKDDGCGISKDDAPYMALSSYTSKIFSFSDLESLETYGFRGEALHALSAVSCLTVISKTERDEAAVSYEIDHCGRIAKTEPCHRPTGTTVQVRELFKGMPVRRQIITNPKMANQDIKTLQSLIKSYGMCKFLLRICYRVDNNIIFAKPGTATLEEAVTYTLGKKVTSNMNWLEITEAEITAKVMVPCKKPQNILEVFQSGAQYIFVNNRPIKHRELEKVLTKLISEALGQETSSRKKPIFVLYILTSAANIDVNLDPNKTSILFKEQNIVVDTIQRYLENFYDIHREVQQEGSCDLSVADYQDYTQKSIGNAENERPACKKRKLQAEKSVVKVIEKNANADEVVKDNLNSVERNFNRAEEPEIRSSEQHNRDENSKKSENGLNIQVPPLNLSETDSNDSQKFTLVHGENIVSRNSLKETTEESTEDSPPFELTPESETLSQLPIVDLGDDFPCLSTSTDEKENHRQNIRAENSHNECNLSTKKQLTLKEWSKGHVSGLKGGTDVHAYNYTAPDELSNDDVHRRVCEGFLKFSKRIRSQVMEQNSTMTAAQVAHVITNLWKKLPPEERGYYRDLARDEKSVRDVAMQDAKRKPQLDMKKNNRLRKALEKMKAMNVARIENLITRTTIPWDVNLKKVTDCFLNNTPCKNTNSVVGPLNSNLWVVHKSAHIWILDARNLRRELHIPDTNTNEENADNIELLLQQRFSTKTDFSLLHPIHLLTKNTHNA